MADREKLIELLSTADDYEDRVCRSYRRYSCKTCPYKGMDCTYRAKADHLIANGVTVQKWIPASEPPKDTYEYWIAYKAGGDYYYSTGYFDGKCWCSALTHHKIPVTHWMPLPELPKGE